MSEQSSRKPESYVVTSDPQQKESFGAQLMRLLAFGTWGMAVLLALLTGGTMPSIRGDGFSLAGILLILLGGGVSGGILWAVGELMENVHRIAQSLRQMQVTPVVAHHPAETGSSAAVHDAVPSKPIFQPGLPVTPVVCEETDEIICPDCGKRQRKGRTFCAFCSASFTVPHEDNV